MTHPDRENPLEERFQSYQTLKRKGDLYSAAVYLAETSHASARLPVAQRAAWNSRIEKEELSEEFLREARSGLKQSIERVHRILSIGTEWTGEEILLVMQLRIEIKLLSDFLVTEVVGESLKQLEQIDAQLAILEKSEDHSRHFTWGLRQMKKHWMSDIEPVWRSLIDPSPENWTREC